MDVLTKIVEEILAERARQIELGYTDEIDYTIHPSHFMRVINDKLTEMDEASFDATLGDLMGGKVPRFNDMHALLTGVAREKMVQIAAVALAGIRSIDVRNESGALPIYASHRDYEAHQRGEDVMDYRTVVKIGDKAAESVAKDVEAGLTDPRSIGLQVLKMTEDEPHA